MFNKKRAQGIPMETVIIAIIVLVVLVVIIAFFVGGTGSVMSKFGAIFSGAKGDDLVNVKNSCQQLCDSATGGNLEGKASAFCRSTYKLDPDNKGVATPCEVEGSKLKFKAYHCDESPISVPCSLDCAGTPGRIPNQCI